MSTVRDACLAPLRGIPADFCALAMGRGGAAIRVDGPAALRIRLREALAQIAPVLVEIEVP